MSIDPDADPTRFSLPSVVVSWQREHGRNDLPWQGSGDPYRVWLSEIMLQQTQVVTVRLYFERFLARFADVRALAEAPIDDVLALWAGLGYYSRARNLHRCAQVVSTRYGGEFPRSARELQTLPGIGKSTAAAIAAICFAERVAILDGNVRRVLARFLAFDADLARASNERDLWDQATKLLPKRDLTIQMPRYTQAMMDLGATVCTIKKPACGVCPLAPECLARRREMVDQFPRRSHKIRRSTQSIWLLWARSSTGEVWLERRPTRGIWAGLYCMPWFDNLACLQAALPAGQSINELPAVKHVLTHKDLHLHPVQVDLDAHIKPMSDGAWMTQVQWRQLGLPGPISKLLHA